MKNVVFIPNVNIDNVQHIGYQCSINSWKHWCKKNNCELFIWEDLIFPMEEMKVTWQRYYVFDMLEANNIEYDQILMVDADMIVHPDCPNFFNDTNNKFTSVHDYGVYEWILRSIENYSKHVFNGHMIDFWKYINGGFQIVNKNHKDFYKKILEFYNTNKDLLLQVQQSYGVGTDQTVLNFLLELENIDVNLLSYEYNMGNMPAKEILDDELTFTKIGYIYHFNGIPDKEKSVPFWMKKTYDHLFGQLTKN